MTRFCFQLTPTGAPSSCRAWMRPFQNWPMLTSPEAMQLLRLRAAAPPDDVFLMVSSFLKGAVQVQG